MSRVRQAVFALLFGVFAPIIPTTTFAGGGVAPSGGGRGGGAPAAVSVNVDHTRLKGVNFDFLDFYPRNATVHQGDTVNFHWVESNGNTFHTVTFVPAGAGLTQQSLARLIPGGGGPVPDKDDPGKPSLYLSLNPDQQVCGNSAYFPGTAPCSYDGRSVVNSGVQFSNSVPETGQFRPTPPLHWSVTMNVRPGVYHYFCLVHGPGMNGTITVVAPGAATPSPAQQAQSAVSQFRAQAAEAAGIKSHVPAPTQQVQAGHTTWTITAGLNAAPTSKLETDEFSAPNLAIKAGDTVVWQPRGFHTVAFPANAGVPAVAVQCESGRGPDRTYMGSLKGCIGAEATLTRGAFPTGPPGAAYTGGFVNSGILVVPNPHAWTLTFPKAGSYRYQCLIHYGMYGTITVS